MVHDNYAIDLRARKPAVLVEEEPVHLHTHYPFFMRATAIVLIVGITCVPLTSAYADELGDTPIDVPSVADAVVVEDPAPVEPVTEPEVTEVSEVSQPEETEMPVDTEVVSEEEVLPEETGTTTEATEATATTTEEAAVLPEAETEEVIQEEISPYSPEVAFRAESNNQYVFQTSDCVVVDDGAFYCIKHAQDEGNSGDATQPVRVYVAQDGDGDTEIYRDDNGVVTKLSDNRYDDDAPVYDARTGRVVWHGNINDRYQIFLYDGGVRQLTQGSTNSQHPHIDGDTVVYQSWVDENWEVFALNLSEGGEPKRLSGSGGHDMFPKVFGNFVTWQSREGDEWRAKGMNLDTGEFSDLGAGTQGDVESARLVLLVERRNAVGDVERVGYDIDTGESVQLSTKPVEPVVPDELPSPYEEPVAIPPAQSTTTIPVKEDLTPPEDVPTV